MLIAPDGGTVTFGQFRDRAERVAAGLHGMGITTGSIVSWQLPTRIDTVVLSMALARLGAVQNPIIHLYREREVGFALRQTGAELFVIPAAWRDTDFVAIAERALADVPTRPTILSIDDGLPEGDPAVLPAPPQGTTARGRPHPLDLLHVGLHRRAQGRPAHRPDADRGRLGPGPRPRHGARRRRLDRLPLRAHRRPRLPGDDAVHGVPRDPHRGLLGPDVLPVFRRHGATMVGGSTAFYVAYLAEQRKTPADPILPTLRLMSGGGAPKPPEVHYEVRDEIGGRGVVHGYGMTEVPMITNGSPHDTDEQLANTDGKPVEGADVRVVTLDGRAGRPRRGGRGPGQGRHGLPRLHRPGPRRRRLRRGRLLPHGRPGAVCEPTDI